MSDRRPAHSSPATSSANKRPRPQRPQRAGGSSPARATGRSSTSGVSGQLHDTPAPRSASEGSAGPGRAPASTRPAGRPHVPLAFGYGVVAALGAVVVLMVPVFAAWTLDAQSTTSWNDTLGVTIDLWALAHRAHVVVDGSSIVFSPLLLTLACVWAARMGARGAFPDERLRAHDLRAIFIAFVGGYVIAAQVLGVIASLGHSHIAWWSLIVGPAAVALLGVAWTAWHERRHSPELAALDEVVIEATPLLARRSLRSALRGLGVFTLLAFVALLALVAWHGGRIWAVHDQLSPGVVGGILLVAGQLLALPNLVALMAGWMTGAPMHIGEVTIGHSGMTPGTLPMVPVFGALPEHIGGWTWVALLAPLAAGAFVGWDASASLTRLSSLRAKLVVAACAAGVATVALWLLWWFATASVPGGLLGYVGPGWAAWALLPALFLPSALAAAGVRHWQLNHAR